MPNRKITTAPPTTPASSKRTVRTPAEQRAEIERVAREHGADLSEDAFNKALRKVGRRASAE